MVNKELFELYNIDCVKYSDISKTGAIPEKINLCLFTKLQNFQEVIKNPFYIVKNGLNSGVHSSKSYHFKGLAVDIAFFKDIDWYDVYKASLEACFKGVGIYWNGKKHSFHFDCRPEYGFWKAFKKDGIWIYSSLFKDVKKE